MRRRADAGLVRGAHGSIKTSTPAEMLGRGPRTWGVSPRITTNQIVEPAKRAMVSEPGAVATGSKVQLSESSKESVLRLQG